MCGGDQSGGAGGIRTTEPTGQPCIVVTSWMPVVASMMRYFEHASFPTVGSLAARPPCWQGKMQGISPIQPLFAKIRHENMCEFSRL